MTGLEMKLLAGGAKPVIGVGMRVVEQYVTAGLSRRYKQKLTRALVAALVQSAPLQEKQEKQPANILKKILSPLQKGAWRIRARRGMKREARRVSNGAGLEPLEIAAANDELSAPALDWRKQLAAALVRLVERDGEVGVTLVGDRDVNSWANAVAIDFAMRIRADPRLGFVVAQLQEDDERARFGAALEIANKLVLAIGLLSGATVAAATILAAAIGF